MQWISQLKRLVDCIRLHFTVNFTALTRRVGTDQPVSKLVNALDTFETPLRCPQARESLQEDSARPSSITHNVEHHIDIDSQEAAKRHGFRRGRQMDSDHEISDVVYLQRRFRGAIRVIGQLRYKIWVLRVIEPHKDAVVFFAPSS